MEIDKPDSDPKNPQKLTLWEIIGSVFAAAFGVQSNKNRERDFTKAKPSTYIIAGILFTLGFVFLLLLVVKLVLNQLTA